MDIKEAYKVMQENCGIEVGDKVRVLRKAKDYEMGWGNSWADGMDDWIGNEFIVNKVWDGEGIKLDTNDDYYNFPFFVLEIVEKHNTKKKIVIDGKDIYISKESFEELKKQLLEG